MSRLRLDRLIRVYGKKRGHRRSGSVQMRAAWLSLFFAGLFLAGWCTLFVVLTMLALPELRVNQEFMRHQATVLDKRVRIELHNNRDSYRPELFVRYELNGKTYERWTYDITGVYTRNRPAAEEALANFQVGTVYPLWYDPADPRDAVMVRGYTSYVWLILFLPLPFIAIGGGGLFIQLYGWRTSAERRSALAQQASDFGQPEQPTVLEPLPTVPDDEPITNSPGTHLSYRLPADGTRLWSLLAECLGTLAWNALACVFVTLSVRDINLGRPEWLLYGGTLLVVGAGVYFSRHCYQGLWNVLTVGRTLIEISDHPLYPGRQYKVWLSQSGRVGLDALELTLVCEEIATFHQGTNTRSESRRVLELEIYQGRSIALRPEAPFEVQRHFLVPPGVMHSLRCPNNEIRWQLLVEGSPPGLPSFQRRFPVVIHPQTDTAYA